MEKAKLISETKQYVICPYCNEGKSRVDHLFSESTKLRDIATWNCDKCLRGYKVSVKRNEIFIEKTDHVFIPKIVLLQNANVLLVLKSFFYDGFPEYNHDEYYYNEGTCPVNYLNEVVDVIDIETNDIDPHGIFKYIGSAPYIDHHDFISAKGLIDYVVAKTIY